MTKNEAETIESQKVREVPFADLIAPDEINARGGGSSRKSIQGLAAAIEAKGIIIPLVVRPADGGKFEVADGRRRFKAMQLLVREKKMKKKDLVPVIVRNEDDMEALETSLMANTECEDMHPVEQHATFARLIERGRTEADIAATYCLDPRTVKQRLALGKLAPAIRQAWQAGKIDAEAAQAFTMHDNHEVQVAAFDRLKKARVHIDRSSIRRELASERLPVSDVPPAVLEKYLSAGGTITESLFDDERFVDDGALIRKLRLEANQQRIAEAQAWLEGQGWGWVAAATDLPTEWRWQWERIRVEFSFSAEELEAQRQIEAQIETAENHAAAEELEAKLAQLELQAEIDQFTPQMRARSGAVIDVQAWNGQVSIAIGLVRPSADGTADLESAIDARRVAVETAAGTPVVDGDEDVDGIEPVATAEPETGPLISTALLRDITAAQTDAARAALVAGNHQLALRVAVAALHAPTYSSPAKLTITHEAADRRHGGGDFHQVLASVAAKPIAELLELFAGLVGESLNLEALSNQSPRHPAEAFVAALDGEHYLREMRERFAVDDYFKRAGRDLIFNAIGEMEEAGITGPIPDDAIDWKKTALGEFAAKHARSCGWLPAELRHPAYELHVKEQRRTGKDAAAEQSGEVAA